MQIVTAANENAEMKQEDSELWKERVAILEHHCWGEASINAWFDSYSHPATGRVFSKEYLRKLTRHEFGRLTRTTPCLSLQSAKAMKPNHRVYLYLGGNRYFGTYGKEDNND